MPHWEYTVIRGVQYHEETDWSGMNLVVNKTEHYDKAVHINVRDLREALDKLNIRQKFLKGLL